MGSNARSPTTRLRKRGRSLPKPQPIAPREGDVWDVQLSPTVGVDQSGIRPALVVSNDWFNETENYLIIIVPITGTIATSRLSTR